MKKILSIILIFSIIMILVACSQETKLYVLNVGDYIDRSLVQVFEEENNCKVIYTEVNSNEEIYQKLKNEAYDICVVSDYMIDRMYQEGLIINLFEEYEFENYDFEDLLPNAKTFLNDQCSSYADYFIPYFWGTMGILYNTDVEGLEEYITQFDTLEAIYTNNEYNKGMYNAPRDSIAMALMVLGLDLNSDNEEDLEKASNLIKSVTYRAWGDDNLKEMVHQGMLDMALVYSGDYLDEYYQCEIDDDEINFYYYAPEKTNIWVDGMVVTSQSKNKELACKFLDFFTEEENQAQNSDFIGYCPLNQLAYDILFLSEEDGGYDYDMEDEFFIPYNSERKIFKYVSDKHYNMLNDLLEESKSK
ncbi:extracellular solute-binding protein [bacterium]|nr:extracellular solute-binding protein [bacterium]